MYQMISYGIVIGFSIGLIIGPIAIMCIRRSITNGFLMGLATGLGAALAHFIYGSIAAFGLTMIKNFLISQGNTLRFLGSIYLLYLGIKSFFSPVSQEVSSANDYRSTIIATFLFNLTNPITITAYAAFLTMMNVSISGFTQGVTLLIGIFIGNMGWWLFLSFTSTLIGAALQDKMLS